MRIITVTLNPSVDITLHTDGLDTDAANRVLSETMEAGGKGIMVAAVCTAFGAAAAAWGIAGAESDPFTPLLQSFQMPCRFLHTAGAVRENLTLRCGDTAIKINRKGTPVSPSVFRDFTGMLQAHIVPGDYAVFSGSIPAGMPTEEYVRMMLAIRDAGGVIVVDSDLLTLDDYAVARPRIIKPNIHELRRIVPFEGSEDEAIVAAAESLRAVGVGQVLVSMGGDGLMLVADRVWKAAAPPVVVRSTVGAGDSALAGFLIGLAQDAGEVGCVRLAAACGSATASLEGSRLTDREMAAALLSKVIVRPLR